MSFSAISGVAELDASDYTSGADDVIDAQEGVGASSDGMSDSLFDVDPAGVAASGALLAIGTAAQGVLDDTQQLREELGRTSVDMDLTASETEALARSMSDATFPLDDVSRTMDALARQGVETEEEMVRLAEASDLLADATGTSAESVANNLAPAVRGLDGDLDAIEENADAFTGAVRNTTLEMDDLAMTMERSSDELKDMGVESDEAAALIAAYGEETGKSGQQLRRDFSSALRDADGDMGAFMQSTGLTESQVSDLRSEMGQGSEQSREYADAANDSLTPMDELRASFDDAKLSLGSYLEPVAAGAPALQALGTAGLFMSTINFAAVIPSIVGVMTALAPVLPILLGVGAIIGGLVVAWRKGWINPVETATWAAGKIGDAIDWLIGMFMDFYPPIVLARELWESNFLGIQDTTEDVFGVIGDLIDWIVEKLNSIPGVEIGDDGVEVDEDELESDGEEAGVTYSRGASKSVDDEFEGTPGQSGGDDLPVNPMPEADVDDYGGDEFDPRDGDSDVTAVERPDRSSRQESLTADDIREAMTLALQDVRYMLELDTDRDGLERFIDERAEMVVREAMN